ncbi:hypothetical protein EPA93_45240 [Ktedonosporobacter rubrisoli]|uniref:Uncharacterized protein n=1 Tax=Ktedonosporobacter rubrisoli TaxID=2509675 RepID=A0A4V0Z0D0_KTERU|nr:hypothetical protein [Ktedonosporobacter rubrisoli]QBD82791.1 hypothetical protein EPA93_45240 [Ktedonosporobacter rubrisoli]
MQQTKQREETESINASASREPQFECIAGKNTVKVAFSSVLWSEYFGYQDGVYRRSGTVIKGQMIAPDIVQSESTTGSIHHWRLSDLVWLLTIRPSDEALKLCSHVVEVSSEPEHSAPW